MILCFCYGYESEQLQTFGKLSEKKLVSIPVEGSFVQDALENPRKILFTI